ncbi:alpha/beta hydrolase family protein [Caulobacter sp. UNC279MFTsu5.1]|uniref:alpha/beta hydrolase n=1 Tax=Caulobacter sp. UNC279MFTsu5.1 TaxID=1502775 RepID=UPI0008F337A4|nr:alpha/beta fold hydrolase [Caulobacter sp. UNC279MFTsu5.1]SFK24681.1 Putative esterase [Caulobacter sp. UNC279MFTsu5.1]
MIVRDSRGQRAGGRFQGCLAVIMALGLAMPMDAGAQVTTKAPPAVPGARPATVERIKVHSVAIEGNLEGESADRDVLVVLPPGYKSHPDRRYPVVYALHGYSIGAEQWVGEIHVPQTIEGAFAKGAAEMIVVLPDSKTIHNGSMYSSSRTTGDFETFVANDLVRYIDGHYRTLPRRESRGLVGHSMGGYGASRIGMRHADVFGALYMMSPCCLSPRDPGQFNAEAASALAQVKTVEDAQKLSWGLRAQLATAAAWSPNPNKPPLYLDLPVENGQVQPDVLAKWAANAPLAFVDQYVGALRRYKAIAIDVGDRDGLKVDAAKLHEVLDRYGVVNSFEIYSGDHTSDVPSRFQENVLPFFSKNLAFQAR